MIDSIGGMDRVNNYLTTLNLKPISVDKLKKMERRAGAHVETVADRSMSNSAAEAFTMEMRYNQVLYSKVQIRFVSIY